MKRYFFSAEGRFNRARFWLGQVAIVAASLAAVTFGFLLTALPYALAGDSKGSVNFIIPSIGLIVVVAIFGLCAWAGICLGIKRFHDLGKPGVWVLIQFAPLVGPIWYFIEAGCVEGARGPNVHGLDPLRPELGAIAPMPVAARAQGRPGWVLPLMMLMTVPGVMLLAGGAAVGAHATSWLKSAIHVEGRVASLIPTTSTDSEGKSSTSYRPVYEARTPEGEPISVKDFWSVSPAPAVGSRVELAYLPGKPDAAIPNTWTMWIPPVVLLT